VSHRGHRGHEHRRRIASGCAPPSMCGALHYRSARGGDGLSPLPPFCGRAFRCDPFSFLSPGRCVHPGSVKRAPLGAMKDGPPKRGAPVECEMILTHEAARRRGDEEPRPRAMGRPSCLPPGGSTDAHPSRKRSSCHRFHRFFMKPRFTATRGPARCARPRDDGTPHPSVAGNKSIDGPTAEQTVQDESSERAAPNEPV
jgi:hypothetical protein